MRYYLPDRGETKEDAAEFPYKGEDYDKSHFRAAEAAAAHFYWHGGHELEDTAWPIVFVIVEDPSHTRYKVEKVTKPDFSASLDDIEKRAKKKGKVITGRISDITNDNWSPEAYAEQLEAADQEKTA